MKMQVLANMLGSEVLEVREDDLVTRKGRIVCTATGKVVLKVPGEGRRILGSISDLSTVRQEYRLV